MDLLNILWIFLISFGLNYFFFIFAWIFKSDVFTDLTYTLSFLLIMIIFLAWKQNFHINQILVFSLVSIWAIRLGTYLFTRIIKIKVDHRFDTMRNSFLKFGGFWTFQAFTVFITILPAAMFLTIDEAIFSNANTEFFSLFLLITLFGLIFESIADYQKNIFFNNLSTEDKKSRTKFIDFGLWKVCRHPNYFGEILFWYGIIMCFVSSYLINENQLINYLVLFFFISPLYLNISLIYLSGIKLLLEKEIIQYKDNEKYKNYLRKTSMLIPFIGKKGMLSTIKNKDFL